MDQGCDHLCDCGLQDLAASKETCLETLVPHTTGPKVPAV